MSSWGRGPKGNPVETRQPWAGFGMVTELRPGNGIHTVAVKVTVNFFEPEGLKWRCQEHRFIAFNMGGQIYWPQHRPGTPLWSKSRRLCRMGSLLERAHWFIWGLAEAKLHWPLGSGQNTCLFHFSHFWTQLCHFPSFWHFQCNHKYGSNFPSTNLNQNGDKFPKGLRRAFLCPIGVSHRFKGKR